MSEEHDRDIQLSRRIRDLPLPRPEAAYRERVRRQFAGEVAAEPLPLPDSSSRRGLIWGGLGLAAAVLAVVLLVTSGGAPAWQVMDFAGAVHVTVDGTQLPIEEAMGMELRPGARIVGCPKGEITLGTSRGVSFVLAPQAEVSVGREAGPDGAAALSAEVISGTTWGTTGEDLPVGGFCIRTAGAEVRVRGTTFAVSSGADTTCICVLDGTVEVVSIIDGTVHRVPPMSQLFVAHDRAGARLEDLPDPKAAKLREIHDRGIHPAGARQL